MHVQNCELNYVSTALPQLTLIQVLFLKRKNVFFRESKYYGLMNYRFTI